MKSKFEFILPLVAMVFIFCLESYAISKGIDGKILTLSIGCLSGLGGYTLSQAIKNSKNI